MLAAGAARRFGGPKQLEPVGPDGEVLFERSLRYAAPAGFGRALLVIRDELRPAFEARLRSGRVFLPVELVPQRAQDLPGSPGPPTGRTYPWGTAHAVWSVREQVTGPFAVVNADDYYGPEAFESVARFLAGAGETRSAFAVVGYRLDRTLLTSGGVSRALCRIDGKGRLTSLTEVLAVEQREENGEITGIDQRGVPVTLRPHDVVSMNFWALTPAIFGAIEAALRRFVEARSEPGSELHLPAVIDELIRAGEAHVRVLPTEARAFGLTHAGDLDLVRGLLGASSPARVERTP